MSNYCTLDEVKSELHIDTKADDDLLMGMIEQTKEFLDDLLDRQFDTTVEGTKYFDGSTSPLLIDDLVSITGDNDGIWLDEDGDATHEATMASTDYILYPLNNTPKTMVKISGDSDYGGFASGIKRGVKIIATWGYGSTVARPIRRASIIQVCRWFKRKDSAFGDVIGTSELGTISMYKGLDPDIAMICRRYKRYKV